MEQSSGSNWSSEMFARLDAHLPENDKKFFADNSSGDRSSAGDALLNRIKRG
jgi:hypothetical protein